MKKIMGISGSAIAVFSFLIIIFHYSQAQSESKPQRQCCAGKVILKQNIFNSYNVQAVPKRTQRKTPANAAFVVNWAFCPEISIKFNKIIIVAMTIFIISFFFSVPDFGTQ